jgi:hypothetical protein
MVDNEEMKMFKVFQVRVDEMAYHVANAAGHDVAARQFPAYDVQMKVRRGSKGYTHDMVLHFDHVANIDCATLEDVFEIGNGYGDQSKIEKIAKMYSVSVGDLIVDSVGDWYMCDPIGWTKVFTPNEEAA